MDPFALKAKKELGKKVSDGTYKYEDCDCFCGANDSILVSETDRYGNYYPLVLCKKCGIMRANPRLNETAYVDFYAHDYRVLYGNKISDRDERYEKKIKQAEDLYNFVSRHIGIPRGTVVFDIDCNMGSFLVPFHKNGCEVMGADYDEECIEFGRKKTGLNLEIGGVEKLKGFGKKADIVILNHVLEHFLDIDKELKSIRDIIKPGGFIFIAVPGTLWWIKNMCASDIMALLQNAHLWQLTMDSLRYVMECCGFEFVYGDERVRAIFKATDVYRNKKNPPKDEYKKTSNYIMGIEHRHLPRIYARKFLELVGVKKHG